MLTNAPRGTADVLPAESYALRKAENRIIEIAENFGFREIRTPTFEHTELFCRSVGDTSDVVQKEMYTFLDKGDRSITLRPEGTAGAMRAAVEKGLTNEAMPQKLYYLLSCFRYEKPQAGRLREFHQFGVEMLGTENPRSDAEVIALADTILRDFSIPDVTLEINSLGCRECRGAYLDELRRYFREKSETLCETCRGRLERNPLRILDCKSPVCHGVAKDAPKVRDFLCDGCREHYEGVRKNLDLLGVKYIENPDIVRGLDYYNRTVFEFVSTSLGAQSTVCGGGRYDGLISELGGNDCPSLGFGLGMERLMNTIRASGKEPEKKTADIYLASIGDAAADRAYTLALELRKLGVEAEYDSVGRSLKAQMKYADKTGARYCAVLGDDEVKAGTAAVKNMATGDTVECPFEKIAEIIK